MMAMSRWPCMICMGIWFPVRKAVKMAPAEALHYE